MVRLPPDETKWSFMVAFPLIKCIIQLNCTILPGENNFNILLKKRSQMKTLPNFDIM